MSTTLLNAEIRNINAAFKAGHITMDERMDAMSLLPTIKAGI